MRLDCALGTLVSGWPNLRYLVFVICALLLLAPFSAQGQSVNTSVPVGMYPQTIGINPLTNKIYTVDEPDNEVIEIDGPTNTTTVIRLGPTPDRSLAAAIAINPVTNNIYAINVTNKNVYVIDGKTRAVITVPTGAGPYALAVNPITNQIYVANFDNCTHRRASIIGGR
jgi:YVTN family beta-propeller protein